MDKEASTHSSQPISIRRYWYYYGIMYGIIFVILNSIGFASDVPISNDYTYVASITFIFVNAVIFHRQQQRTPSKKEINYLAFGSMVMNFLVTTIALFSIMMLFPEIPLFPADMIPHGDEYLFVIGMITIGILMYVVFFILYWIAFSTLKHTIKP